MRILYVLTTGTADPTKASLPVHMVVNGSLAIGDEPEIFMAGDGTEYLAGDAIEHAQGRWRARHGGTVRAWITPSEVARLVHRSRPSHQPLAVPTALNW